jgi:hypothetical protein
MDFEYDWNEDDYSSEDEEVKPIPNFDHLSYFEEEYDEEDANYVVKEYEEPLEYPLRI